MFADVSELVISGLPHEALVCTAPFLGCAELRSTRGVSKGWRFIFCSIVRDVTFCSALTCPCRSHLTTVQGLDYDHSQRDDTRAVVHIPYPVSRFDAELWPGRAFDGCAEFSDE